jgi:hypothetical protein
MHKVTNETERTSIVSQAAAAGASVDADAIVVKIGDEFAGIYAVADDCDYVFVERGGGLFVPADRYALIDAITEMLAGETPRRYVLNLSAQAGDERVATGWEQEIEAATAAEAIDLYRTWLLEGGFDEEEIDGRILCDGE